MQRNDERLFYVVQFTNVTWGEDLGATIDTYITGKTEAVPRWKQYIRNVPVGVSVLIAVTVTLISSLAALMRSEVTGAVATVGTINTKYGDFSKLANSLNTADQKLSFLVDSTILRMQTEPISAYSFVRTGIVCLAIVCVIALLSIRERSFISLNDVSHRRQKTGHTKYEFVKYGLLVAGVVGIVSGVFAIRIYDLIKDWL